MITRMNAVRTTTAARSTRDVVLPRRGGRPAADDLDYELERFHQKLEAGAQFAMTQVLFDLAYLESFLERLGGSCPIPLLVGIFYVRSHSLALRLHNEVPGIVVPSTSRRDSGTRAQMPATRGSRSRAS